jgi:hypothetical protein
MPAPDAMVIFINCSGADVVAEDVGMVLPSRTAEIELVQSS